MGRLAREAAQTVVLGARTPLVGRARHVRVRPLREGLARVIPPGAGPLLVIALLVFIAARWVG